jgi:Zn-dependent peptidase ImmA (M78 family)
MESIKSINPERIAWCCHDYGITPTELASELGVAVTSMNGVMAGEKGMTFAQLSKVAEYFGRGALFFLEGGPVSEAGVHTPQFRTLANQKPESSPKLKKLVEQVERQREVYLSLLEDLDEPDRQQFAPPDLSGQDPQRTAAMVREWLALKEENDFETYRAALAAKSILVFRSNGYGGKWQIPKESPILGFTLYDSICPVIVIKKQVWHTQQSFTLMHELGHLLLHKSSSIDDEQDLESHQGHERDANAFAGHLLVPDEFLARIEDATRPDDECEYDNWLKFQRKRWGVSGEVILRRLLDTGRLTQSQYTAYRKWRAKASQPKSEGGNRQYRYREPRHMFGDAFVLTVLDALNERQITLAKASSYLDNLKIKDLHKLENLYAGL